jgi:proteasome lid subunit RPN8/RPN11
MRSFLNKLTGWLLRRPEPRITCRRSVWDAGVAELERRTNGHSRESGAFLLGRAEGGAKQILEFVFYDDIDPHSLDTGIVHFAGNRLPILWEHCRKRGYGVVADVHVHPGGYWQSASDQADPVMPRAGHIAFILPDYASRGTRPGSIGMYEYLGDNHWKTHTPTGSGFFCLTVLA